jgi:hypothetical protein
VYADQFRFINQFGLDVKVEPDTGSTFYPRRPSATSNPLDDVVIVVGDRSEVVSCDGLFSK